MWPFSICKIFHLLVHNYLSITSHAVSEESREQLLKGLKKSTSNVRNNTIVIVGAAGSGKTSAMALMMGRKPPQIRTSTGCTTCPVRGMTTTRISKSGQKWEIISPLSLSRQLATTAKVVAMHRAEQAVVAPGESQTRVCSQSSFFGDPSQTQAQQQSAESETTVSSRSPFFGDPSQTQAQQQSAESKATVFSQSPFFGKPLGGEATFFSQSPFSGDTLQTQAQQESVEGEGEATPTGLPTHRQSGNTGPYKSTQISSDIVEDLGSMLEADILDEGVELFNIDCVSLLDSGGQPAFHDLFPLFVHNPSAALFTFNLSEALSSHYMVSYWKEGKQVGKPYRSSLNNEQIISSCMRSIFSQAPSEEARVDQSREKEAGGSREGEGQRKKMRETKLAFIGTHRDMEFTCTDETRADKEKKLAAMIPPSLRPHVLRCSEVNELIFALNAKEPENIDEITMLHLQHELVENSPAEWQQIPTSYYAIDLALQALAEKLGRYVLSIEECKQEAEKLEMEEKTMMAALRYLHNLNILFYYDDEMALPGLVFVNGQVLLDKITELVEKSHQLRETPFCGMTIGGEWEEVW